jgi:RHS repeat-associated protein
VINDSGDVVKYYTYEPFGEVIDDDGTFDNAFHFTGQYFDSEIEEYYLRARQYNPQIARFTSRDPVGGTAERPPTLHRYLYCWNDQVNRIDPDGEVLLTNQVDAILTGFTLYNHALELGTYAAAEDKWDFFHLMETTIMYMTIASRMPIAGAYVVFGWGATTIIDNAGTISGMSVQEGLLMDPTATYFYLTTMLAVELELGISRADMEEFGQWHHMLWPTKW